VRGAAIRVAPNVYNTPDDFGRLAECIRRAKR
jgi:selenocysteine lyase/cysteine desulfurase